MRSYPPMRKARSVDGAAREKKSSLKRAFGLYRYLLAYKSVFIPSLIALFITAGLSLAFPYFLSQLVGPPQDALRDGVDVEQVASRVNSVIISLLIVLAVQAIITFFRVQGFIRSGESALNDVRHDVFGHILALPMSFHMSQRSGELSGRIATDLGILRDTLLTTIPALVRHSVILLGGLIFVVVASPKLALIMLGSIPLVVLSVAIIGGKIRKFSKAAQSALSDSQVVVEEAVQGIYAVKSYTNEPLELKKYDSALDRFLAVTLKGALARGAFIGFIIFVMMGTIAAVIWYGAQMFVRQEITSEEFTRFILFSIIVGASLSSLPEVFSSLQKTAGATERIEELMELDAELPPTIDESQPVGGSIDLSKVGFAYPKADGTLAKPLFKDLDLQIADGERVAIVGSSGAGKSTLFSLLLGFYQAQKGSISFGGKPLSELGVNAVRKAIAVVPQDVLLFGGSIAENIAYGRPDASPDEIQQAAAKANAADFINSVEDGYETLVGPRGLRLSGGQRQRLAIARAILADPSILLLDEATSSLDSESEGLVQAALDELMKGRTSLVIAHRLSTVRNVDRIIVLEDGAVVETGSHEELMAAGGRYASLAQTQLISAE